MTISTNEPLFKISARTQANFVPITNKNVELTDMYLLNLPIPIEIISSDPEIERADPADKEKVYESKFRKNTGKLNKIESAGINNAVFKSLLPEEKEPMTYSHRVHYEMSIFTPGKLQNNVPKRKK